MTEEDANSDMASSRMMMSQRVDTASNISQLSRMNKSGYSARHILNKSGQTGMASEISDTSFSMLMYMPKKFSDQSIESSKKPLEEEQRSYEYKSIESNSNEPQYKTKKKKTK